MLTATVQHGRDGYTLVVQDCSLARVVMAELVDRGCARLGHPLCGGWGWTYDVGIGPWRPYDETMLNLGNVLWVLGQRVLSYAAAAGDERWSQPIPDEVATLIAPWSTIPE